MNLDASKEFGFEGMIYHLKENFATRKYPIRMVEKLILFFNQLLHPAPTQYWPTELE